MSAVALDLDKFEFVNDSLGTAPATNCLKTIAAQMISRVQPTDTGVRLSGDGFVILLATR